MCVCVCCGNCYTCSGSSLSATWQENYLSRHSFSAGIKFSHSATSARASVPTPVPALVPVSASAALHLRFTFQMRTGEEKKRFLKCAKKKRRAFFTSPPFGNFSYLRRVSGFAAATAITALSCKSVEVNQAIRCKKLYKFISIATIK